MDIIDYVFTKSENAVSCLMIFIAIISFTSLWLWNVFEESSGTDVIAQARAWFERTTGHP